MMTNAGFDTIRHDVDLCVVGGGLAGLCAAVAAARHGARVALMQERPMLGGNASSEIRMWVCGAHGANNLETGLLEELKLENMYRNPDRNYSIWDGVMYELARNEPNIELLMNCSCLDCEMDGDAVRSVRGWQLTTQTFHEVTARIFADCSGDSVLAPLTGAEFRVGREARAEFGEDIAPEVADRRTMGMSCMLQAREESRPSTFIPPKWAYKFTRADLVHRVPDMSNPVRTSGTWSWAATATRYATPRRCATSCSRPHTASGTMSRTPPKTASATPTGGWTGWAYCPASARAGAM